MFPAPWAVRRCKMGRRCQALLVGLLVGLSVPPKQYQIDVVDRLLLLACMA